MLFVFRRITTELSRESHTVRKSTNYNPTAREGHTVRKSTNYICSMEYVIRPISPADNAAVAQVIRKVMTEYGCVGEGFSITDPEVDDMHGSYQADRHNFYVVEEVSASAKTIVLVGGYAPLIGGDPAMCELRKMYGYSTIRGKGLGKRLMQHILDAATEEGFTQMYLETASSMKEAAGLYKRFGFRYIAGALGNTGHGGCDDFMLKDLG